jgi:hypothetical protein
MATIFVELAWSREKVEVLDIDFETITNTELINELINNDIIKPLNDGKYILIKGSQLITENNLTLKNLGFTDGDSIYIHQVNSGA